MLKSELQVAGESGVAELGKMQTWTKSSRSRSPDLGELTGAAGSAQHGEEAAQRRQRGESLADEGSRDESCVWCRVENRLMEAMRSERWEDLEAEHGESKDERARIRDFRCSSLLDLNRGWRGYFC